MFLGVYTLSNDRINYGELIKNLRIQNSLTQTELGNMISLGKTAISNYETGYIVPSLGVMESIASVFGLTLLDFLSGNTKEINTLNMPRYRQSASDLAIPYIKVENVKENTIDAQNYMDASLVLPAFMTDYPNGYLCIKMNDDSMKADNISKNDYLIIKRTELPNPRQIVLALDTQNNTYMIRRYIREGHIASLIPSSDYGDYPVVRIDERDSKFVIKGYVERVISKLDF